MVCLVEEWNRIRQVPISKMKETSSIKILKLFSEVCFSG